jgi:hypothetical protein
MISVFNGSLISGVSIATGSLALFLAGWITKRLRSYRGAAYQDLDGDGDSVLSGERAPPLGGEPPGYEPARHASLLHSIQMGRLLRRDDFDFLAAQRGYNPKIGSKLRRDRQRIFHLYLRELAREFLRLHAQARELAAASPEPHPEIVRTLVRQQAAFWLAIVRIEVSFAAGCVYGLVMSPTRSPTVEIGALLECIEALRLDAARHLAPAQAV